MTNYIKHFWYQRRSHALQLYYAIRRNSSDVTYKQVEIAKSLANIFDESDRLGSSSSTMEEDRLEIVRIYHQFPDLILNNIKWSNCVKQSLHLTAKLFLL